MKNWDDLRIFLAAARSGTSRGAARALGINQSTVSRRLAQLEEDHGVRLFERRGRGLELTEPGQEIVDSATQIERSFAALDRRILGRDTQLSGHIRVSVPDFMVAPLAPILAEFAKKYPSIQLEVLSDNGFASLAQREADVVVRLAMAAPDHLVGRRVGGVAAAVYASRQYMRGHRGRELTEHGWVRWGRAWRAIPPERWIEANVPREHIRAVIDNNGTFLELIAAGLGVGFQPAYIADHDRRLVRISPGFDFGLALWLLTHEDIRRTARISTFMRFVGDALSAQRARMETFTESPHAD